MPWFKVDDKWHSHPKVVGLSLAARGLWATAGSWCGDQLTDGKVPKGLLRVWGASAKLAAELVSAGLWFETAEGWQFHQWLEHQPSKEKVVADKARAAQRQQEFRDKKAARNALRDRYEEPANDVSNALRNGPVTVPRPDPTRPVGERGEGERPVVAPLAKPKEPQRLLFELDELLRQEFATRSSPSQGAGRDQRLSACRRADEAVALGKFPDAVSALRALVSAAVSAALRPRGKLGFALEQEPFCDVGPAAPVFDRSCVK